jgi:hypothetical protein
MDEDTTEVRIRIGVNELGQIGLSTLVDPQPLVGLEGLLVELGHKAEAGAFIEEIKFLVVFIGRSFV